MGDIGIVAQRYELVLFGSHQRLELQPWQPETQRTARVPFTWTKDAWYTMKLEVQNLGGGKVRARGKVWPRGEAEPAAWTIERSIRSAASRARRGSTRMRRRRPAAAPSCITTTSRCSRIRNRLGTGDWGLRDWGPSSALPAQRSEPVDRYPALVPSPWSRSASHMIHGHHEDTSPRRRGTHLADRPRADGAIRSRQRPTGRCGAARRTATWSRP